MDGDTARQMGPLWDEAAVCCVASFLLSSLILIFKIYFPLEKQKKPTNTEGGKPTKYKIQNHTVY